MKALQQARTPLKEVTAPFSRSRAVFQFRQLRLLACAHTCVLYRCTWLALHQAKSTSYAPQRCECSGNLVRKAERKAHQHQLKRCNELCSYHNTSDMTVSHA